MAVNLGLDDEVKLKDSGDIVIDPATSGKQDTGNTSLSNIDGKVSTEAKQDTGNTSLSNIDGKVSTEAKQDTGNTSLSNIDTKVSTATKQDDIKASIDSLATSKERVKAANDVVQSFTWLNFATRNERVNTISWTSATLGLTVTDTYAYTDFGGGPGPYRLDSITTVVS